jgi:hypothetical protein
MLTIDHAHTTKIFKTKALADAITATVDPDDDWSYTVVPFGNGFAVRMTDEDGNNLGWWF